MVQSQTRSQAKSASEISDHQGRVVNEVTMRRVQKMTVPPQQSLGKPQKLLPQLAEGRRHGKIQMTMTMTTTFSKKRKERSRRAVKTTKKRRRMGRILMTCQITYTCTVQHTTITSTMECSGLHISKPKISMMAMVWLLLCIAVSSTKAREDGRKRT